MEDWAETRAREWAKGMRLTPRYYIPSLAALLREVDGQCHECHRPTCEGTHARHPEKLK
jgi:hypothetical protein